MSDDKLELSRRKILGSVGAVGAAGAAAGLGTSALFSDEESFTNNSITAGTLDLKVSWDEHYFNGIKNLDDVSEANVEFDSPESTQTGFPSSNGSPYLAVADGAVDTFMNDTRTEQFPDGGLGPNEDPCEELADVPGAEIPPPVIDLDDVKPGDFGEVTFDFSLCDNPGYLWMTGELVSESENSVTEPEGDSPEEDGSFANSSLWPLAALTGMSALDYDGDGDEDGSEATGAAETRTAGDSRSSLWSTLGRGAAMTGAGVAGLSALTGSASAQSGFSVTTKSSSGDSATDLAQSLLAGGTGISINSATYTGAGTAAGTFSGGGSVYGLDNGVILSSGDVTNIEGPNNNSDSISVEHGTPGDSDLLAISDNTVNSTNDAAVLEFDFDVPQGEDKVFFNFVFGSDEYNEFVDDFNDVFGFFLNPDSDPTDDNVALANGDPVSINNINTMDNSGIFNNNDPSDTNTPFATEADGFTDVLQVEAEVNPGQENTLKLAIADANDSALDSWVLIEGQSLSTDPDPDPQPGDGTVELPDKVQARAWYDGGGGDGPSSDVGDNINQDDEQVFLEGTLRQVLDALSSGEGVPLDGDESTNTDFDETSDPLDDTARDCYTAADDVHYIGFEWWVPREVGNEIQSDSVTFDLGFYTEQCRNNDGSGEAPDEDDGDTGTSLVINDQTASAP
jgi:predicted ribosomally synthesized peptide with SipW-like signal peptide